MNGDNIYMDKRPKQKQGEETLGRVWKIQQGQKNTTTLNVEWRLNTQYHEDWVATAALQKVAYVGGASLGH